MTDFSLRPWRDVAKDLTDETDRTRVSELAEELERAMQEQNAGNPNLHELESANSGFTPRS